MNLLSAMRRSKGRLFEVSRLSEKLQKKLPEDIKAMQPEIEWRKVSGMRDRLIHDYFGVDYTIVWDVASNKLPDLRVKLYYLLKQIQ